MGKIIKWLKASNRWKHLVAGIILGLVCIEWFMAVFTAVVVPSALEFKDKSAGNKWDWTDWWLTAIGVFIGFLIHKMIL